MAGLRDPDLGENQTDTETGATPPNPGSSPEVIDLLAALYQRQRKEIDLSLAALMQQQQLKGPGTLAEWLNRLIAEPSSPFLKGEAPLLILRANLPNATPIHIEPNRITACHNGEKLTPHTAMAMATLALADPAMREKGIELEGTEEEQILLFMALRLHGYEKILNPPKFDPQNNPKHAELSQQMMQDWSAYVTHTPGTPEVKNKHPVPDNDNTPKADEQKAEEQLPPLPQDPGSDKWLHPELHNKLMENHGDAFIASNPNKPLMPERFVNFWNKRLDDKTRAKYLADLKLSDPFVDAPSAQQPPVTQEAEAKVEAAEPEEIKPIRELKIGPKAAPVVAAPVPASKKPKRVRKPKAPAAAFEQASSEAATAIVTRTKVPANIFNSAVALTLPTQHVFLPGNSGWDKLSPAMQDRLLEYVGHIFKETYPDAELPAQAGIVAFWDAKQPEERASLLNAIIANEEKNAAADSALRALKPENPRRGKPVVPRNG